MVRKSHFALLYQGTLIELIDNLSLAPQLALYFKLRIANVETADQAQAFMKDVGSLLIALGEAT